MPKAIPIRFQNKSKIKSRNVTLDDIKELYDDIEHRIERSERIVYNKIVGYNHALIFLLFGFLALLNFGFNTFHGAVLGVFGFIFYIIIKGLVEV